MSTIPHTVARIVSYPRPEYKLYVTTVPFETVPSFSKTVDPSTYSDYGVNEPYTYYIAKSKPTWNSGVDGEFTVAPVGSNYEDDYTHVVVYNHGILFSEKERDC